MRTSIMDRWVVGKIITLKPADCDMVIKVFRSVWGAKKLVEALCIKPNIFLFKFNTLEDKQEDIRRPSRVYEQGLGHQDREHYWSGSAFDLSEGEGRLGEFLRIRVEIDMKKQLRMCINLSVHADGHTQQYLLKYERLPSFFHGCGLLDHAIVENKGDKAIDQSEESSLEGEQGEDNGESFQVDQPRQMKIVDLVSTSSGKKKSGEKHEKKKQNKKSHGRSDFFNTVTTMNSCAKIAEADDPTEPPIEGTNFVDPKTMAIEQPCRSP
ncbi:hypothetical protein F3Y22_tig00018827pilonHSYRG00119 [Hibiscus syriacus]|uniref:DUF4283 domain-containing protein n=1 Tax=Hibiscus syriacus TaxID=106335 RepID=A0A6A3C059_HIBSY|nr:hypothetical protein F3Y22_tig00018827pilonHSYRG00119 [Hibiscus syriacus]